MKSPAFAALGLLLLISACSTVPKPQKTPDPSRPNIASIYYNLTASYLHYQGDYLSADQLYNLSLSQDPASPQIRKQILINSCYMFMNNLMSPEQITEILANTRSTMPFDEDMLKAAHTVYAELRDPIGVAWSLDEQLSRYPSARAFLQKFMYQYLELKTKDEALLKKALKLSGDDLEARLLTAQMYELISADKAIPLVQEILKGYDYQPAEDYLIRLNLQKQDSNSLKTQFAQYAYPRDAARMKSFLELANTHRQYSLTGSLQDELLATGDGELVVELAYAGYMGNDLRLMNRIGEFLTSKTPEPGQDGLLAQLLLAFALFEPELANPEQYAAALYSTTQALEIMQYYTLRLVLEANLSTSITDDELYGRFAELVSERYGSTLLGKYLIYQANHREADQTGVAPETYAFARSLIDSGRGDENDFSLVLHYLYTAEDTQQRIAILRIALERFPGNALYLNDLGYSLLDDPQHWNEADELISQALFQEPDNAYYQDSMLWLKYLKGDYAAASQYADLLSLQAELPGEIYYHLGMLYSAQSNKEKATEFLKKAISDSSSPEYQSKAASALEKLGN